MFLDLFEHRIDASIGVAHAVQVEENFFIEVNIRTPQIIFAKNLERLLLILNSEFRYIR